MSEDRKQKSEAARAYFRARGLHPLNKDAFDFVTPVGILGYFGLEELDEVLFVPRGKPIEDLCDTVTALQEDPPGPLGEVEGGKMYAGSPYVIKKAYYILLLTPKKRSRPRVVDSAMQLLPNGFDIPAGSSVRCAGRVEIAKRYVRLHLEAIQVVELRQGYERFFSPRAGGFMWQS